MFDEIFKTLNLDYEVDGEYFNVDLLGRVSQRSLSRYRFMVSCQKYLKDFRRRMNDIDRKKVPISSKGVGYFYECMKKGKFGFRVNKYKLHTEWILREELKEDQYLSLKEMWNIFKVSHPKGKIDWFSTDELRFKGEKGHFRILNPFSFEYLTVDESIFTDWLEMDGGWRWVCPLRQ